jgi:hypothetical protein
MQHNEFRTNTYHLMNCEYQMASLMHRFMASSWHAIDPRNILCINNERLHDEPQQAIRSSLSTPWSNSIPTNASACRRRTDPTNASACRRPADPCQHWWLRGSSATPWSIWGTNQNLRIIFSRGILGEWVTWGVFRDD